MTVERIFDGQVALVTGGGSGLGRGVALDLAAGGASVVVAGRGSDRLDETVRLIERHGGIAHRVVADVTVQADAASMVEQCVAAHGGMHLAVNAAGVLGPFAPTAEIGEDEWRAVLETNLTGMWLSMKHEIAYMRVHGGGAIVNIASTIGPHSRLPGLGAYAASKAAVVALTRTAAREYIADGVRINAVSPGPADTAMSLRPGETEADRAERMRDALPLGRVGTVAEVASAVRWLASPGAGFAVGHDLVVDGGASA